MKSNEFVDELVRRVRTNAKEAIDVWNLEATMDTDFYEWFHYITDGDIGELFHEIDGPVEVDNPFGDTFREVK